MRKSSMIENGTAESFCSRMQARETRILFFQQFFRTDFKFFAVKSHATLVLLGLLLSIPVLGLGASYSRQGGQLPLTTPLVGDQTFPQISIRPFGGYVVWQD